MKDRIYYWTTVTAFAGMMLYVYSEYKDLHKIVEDGHRIQNRQIEMISISNQSNIARIQKQFSERLITVEKYHQAEINAVIAHTQELLDEERQKNEK